MVIGALVAIAVFAGPWALAAVGALTTGGTAVARRVGGRTFEAPPDPALDPPP